MTKARRTNLFFLALICIYIFSIFFVIPCIPDKIINSDFGTIISEVIIAIVVLGYVIGTRGDALKSISFKFVHIWDVFLLIILTYLLLPLIAMVNAISMLFAKNYVTEQMDSMSTNALWLNLLLVAIIPAVVEEITFRGMLYCGYRNSKIKWAALSSAFLFGMFHMNVNQLSYAFVMALLFALIYEASGSIFSTMIVHFCFNGNTVLLTYIESKYATNTDATATTTSFSDLSSMQKFSTIMFYAFMCCITLTIAFFVFRRIAKNNKRWNHIKAVMYSLVGKEYPVENYNEDDYILNEKYGGKIIDVVFLAGVFLCIAFMVYVSL